MNDIGLTDDEIDAMARMAKAADAPQDDADDGETLSGAPIRSSLNIRGSPPTKVLEMQRWYAWGVLETMIHDLRAILCLLDGRSRDPTVAIIDGRTIQSTPSSGSPPVMTVQYAPPVQYSGRLPGKCVL